MTTAPKTETNPGEATARPWHIDGLHIMDRAGNTIAICASGWTDDKANTELIAKAVNEHDALNAIADDMGTLICTEFGSFESARKMAQGSGSIGYWAQIIANYDTLKALRKRGGV